MVEPVERVPSTSGADSAQPGPGLISVEQRTTVATASVMARAGRSDEVLCRMASTYALATRNAAAAVSNRRFAAWGAAPGHWLLFDFEPAPDWPSGVVEAFEDLASVFDQSGAYVLLRLTGPDSARLLQKGLFIDLSDASFPIGAFASAPVSDVVVMVARSDHSMFDVAVPRSQLTSFGHWLRCAAAASAIQLSD